MQVDITDMEARRVAAVEHRGPYNQISEAFNKLGAVAGQAGLFRPGAEMIGRTAALLVDIPVEVYAGRWQVAHRSGASPSTVVAGEAWASCSSPRTSPTGVACRGRSPPSPRSPPSRN